MPFPQLTPILLRPSSPASLGWGTTGVLPPKGGSEHSRTEGCPPSAARLSSGGGKTESTSSRRARGHRPAADASRLRCSRVPGRCAVVVVFERRLAARPSVGDPRLVADDGPVHPNRS